MMITIDILLLLTALIGSLAAFGGDTWIKEAGPFYKRITKPRGWIAIACMISAFGLGVAKEIYTRHLAEIASKQAQDAQNLLRKQLKDAETKIAELRPAFKHALELATAGIPQEVDYPLYEAKDGEDKGTIFSYRTGKPLKLFAGQTLKYYIPSDLKGSVKFKIGDREYPIRSNQGEITVIGIPGKAMPVEIIHPQITEYKEVKTRHVVGFPPTVKMTVRQVPLNIKPIDSVNMKVSGTNALESVHVLKNVQAYLDDTLKRIKQ